MHQLCLQEVVQQDQCLGGPLEVIFSLGSGSMLVRECAQCKEEAASKLSCWSKQEPSVYARPLNKVGAVAAFEAETAITLQNTCQ